MSVGGAAAPDSRVIRSRPWKGGHRFGQLARVEAIGDARAGWSKPCERRSRIGPWMLRSSSSTVSKANGASAACRGSHGRIDQAE